MFLCWLYGKSALFVKVDMSSCGVCIPPLYEEKMSKQESPAERGKPGPAGRAWGQGAKRASVRSPPSIWRRVSSASASVAW